MTSLEDAVAAISPGRYIVAVSGGVDSMALLDCLRRRKDLDIVTAHANHGIRADAYLDAELVESFCRSHNIPYIGKELHLSPKADEAAARSARYDFLQKCRIDNRAQAIITAHHQDDLLETAVINILRGTGWRGVAPFWAGNTVLRPLVNVPKDTLVRYARDCRVPYREDSTNADQRYLRNYVRLTLIPYLTHRNPSWNRDLLQLIRKQLVLRRTIEDELDALVTSYIRTVDRSAVSLRYIWCMLPRTEGYELLQAMCRKTIGHSLVHNLAESALTFARVAKPGKIMPLNDSWQLRAAARDLIVEPRTLVVQ